MSVIPSRAGPLHMPTPLTLAGNSHQEMETEYEIGLKCDSVSRPPAVLEL